MTIELWLESFEGGTSATAAPSPEYERGYSDGYAAAQAAAEEDGARLDGQLVQAVADINFTYAEARSQVLRSLQPLFLAITEKVLPHCVDNGFADQLADQLVQLATIEACELCVHVHPDRVASVAAALSTVEVVADPNLTPYAAWIDHNGQEILLDMDGVLHGISEALAGMQSYQQKDEQHG